MLQVINGTADTLAGKVVEGARLEDGVHLVGEQRKTGRIALPAVHPAGDRLGRFQDAVGGNLGSLHHRLQLQPAVAAGRRRRRDQAGDLPMDAAELLGQVGFAEVDHLHRAEYLRAQLAEAAVDEAAQHLDLAAHHLAHRLA